MTKILLDTSFIILLASKPLPSIGKIENMLGKAEFFIIEDTLKELKILIKNSSVKRSRLAKFSLEFAKNLKCLVCPQNGNVDQKILDCAVDKKLMVATIDMELKRKLRAVGIPVVSLKRDRLNIDGIIIN